MSGRMILFNTERMTAASSSVCSLLLMSSHSGVSRLKLIKCSTARMGCPYLPIWPALYEGSTTSELLS